MSDVPVGLSEDQLVAWATSQPATAPAFRPTDLQLDRVAGLTVSWADGAVSRYPLELLRKRCPCATCRTERDAAAAKATAPTAQGSAGATTGRTLSLNILPAGIDRAVQFVDAKVVGSYAIQITWGDGHSTGIYDYRYLRLIAPRSESP